MFSRSKLKSYLIENNDFFDNKEEIIDFIDKQLINESKNKTLRQRIIYGITQFYDIYLRFPQQYSYHLLFSNSFVLDELTSDIHDFKYNLKCEWNSYYLALLSNILAFLRNGSMFKYPEYGYNLIFNFFIELETVYYLFLDLRHKNLLPFKYFNMEYKYKSADSIKNKDLVRFAMDCGMNPTLILGNYKNRLNIEKFGLRRYEENTQPEILQLYQAVKEIDLTNKLVKKSFWTENDLIIFSIVAYFFTELDIDVYEEEFMNIYKEKYISKRTKKRAKRLFRKYRIARDSFITLTKCGFFPKLLHLNYEIK